MTIRQAYQTLDLEGSENMDTIEKQFIELYNNTQIRLSNEFDQWRKTELEHYIQEIKTARSVLHEIPSAVPVVLPEREYVRFEKAAGHHLPLAQNARSSRHRSSRSIAITLAVIVHILVFACMGWKNCRSEDDDRKGTAKTEQGNGRPAPKNNRKQNNAGANRKNAPKPAIKAPAAPPGIPEKRLNGIKEAEKLMQEGRSRK